MLLPALALDDDAPSLQSVADDEDDDDDEDKDDDAAAAAAAAEKLMADGNERIVGAGDEAGVEKPSAEEEVSGSAGETARPIVDDGAAAAAGFL